MCYSSLPFCAAVYFLIRPNNLGPVMTGTPKEELVEDSGFNTSGAKYSWHVCAATDTNSVSNIPFYTNLAICSSKSLNKIRTSMRWTNSNLLSMSSKTHQRHLWSLCVLMPQSSRNYLGWILFCLLFFFFYWITVRVNSGHGLISVVLTLLFAWQLSFVLTFEVCDFRLWRNLIWFDLTQSLIEIGYMEPFFSR